MRDFLLLTSTFQDILRDLGLPWPEKAVIEPPKDPRHGDLATNLALVLTKQAGMPPRALAERLSAALTDKLGKLVGTDIAGPGFLNVTFAPAFWRQVVTTAEEEGERFGSSDTGHGRKIQLEYVSANPTGPLHIGHGRGATRWRACCALRATTSLPNITSTTRAVRCGFWAYPYTCACARPSGCP